MGVKGIHGVFVIKKAGPKLLPEANFKLFNFLQVTEKPLLEGKGFCVFSNEAEPRSYISVVVGCPSLAAG